MKKLMITMFAAMFMSGVAFTDRSEGNEATKKFYYVDHTAVDSPKVDSIPDSLVLQAQELDKYLTDINSAIK